MEWRAQSRRVTLTSCMDEMSANTRTTWATRCGVQWVKMTTQDGTKLTKILRAHSLVKCRVSCALCWSWLSRRHWCRTSYRSVSPRIRNSKFSSWCYSPNFILSSSTQTVAIIIACCTSRKRVRRGVVFTPSAGYSRPPSAVNDLSVTK